MRDNATRPTALLLVTLLTGCGPVYDTEKAVKHCRDHGYRGHVNEFGYVRCCTVSEGQMQCLPRSRVTLHRDEVFQ